MGWREHSEMSRNVENYRGMKGYKNGSRGEGVGEMEYLRGEDISDSFKAANPSFLKRCGIFCIPSPSYSPLLYPPPPPHTHLHLSDMNRNTNTNTLNRRLHALPIKSNHFYGVAQVKQKKICSQVDNKGMVEQETQP